MNSQPISNNKLEATPKKPAEGAIEKEATTKNTKNTKNYNFLGEQLAR